MSSIKERRYKPRLYVPVNLLAGVEYGRHLARLRRRRRAYAPACNTASHDNHAVVSWLVSSTPDRGMCMGLRLAPELRYNLLCP